MKIEEFTYNEKRRKLLVIKEDEKSIYGLDLNLLTEEEANTVFEVQKEYEMKLEVYTKKAFRNFLKEKVAVIK
ncbi:MAG: hypothetical protein GF311_28410 [Candidatus Lokiarchaeota archaeon]|nr:hypothetical protein [Candidatus Lokiarchaeota archaeon]